MYYLYVKTHNTTNLKYLGYTKRDPYKYKGSGTRWYNHIKKHGYDVTTEIIFQSESKEEVAETGRVYSDLWNVVESVNWANLVIESGDGGDTFKHIDYSKINKTKVSKRIKLLNDSPNNPFRNPEFQKQLQQRMMAKSKPCIHCGKIVDPANYSRHVKKCEKVIPP